MAIDGLLLLEIKRSCIQIGFGEPEGLLYLLEIMICDVDLNRCHLKLGSNDEVAAKGHEPSLFQAEGNKMTASFWERKTSRGQGSGPE